MKNCLYNYDFEFSDSNFSFDLGTCRADKEAEDAEYACKQLDIPFQTVNFVKQYWNEVFEKLVNEYEQGWTPNPDVDCNRHIKFGSFYQHCREHIGIFSF